MAQRREWRPVGALFGAAAGAGAGDDGTRVAQVDSTWAAVLDASNGVVMRWAIGAVPITIPRGPVR